MEITIILSEQDLADFLDNNTNAMDAYVNELHRLIVDYYETENVGVYYSANQLTDSINIDGEDDDEGIIAELMNRMVNDWSWLPGKNRLEVIEDNGGGLYLVVLDDETPVAVFENFEYLSPKDVMDSINGIINGDDYSRWDGAVDEPVDFYNELTGREFGWQIVAQWDGKEFETYPDCMGAAAQLAFGVDND